MITVGDLFNQEELLDFALHYMSMCNSDDEPHPVAEQIIIAYIMMEYKKQKVEFTAQDISDRMSELITDYILTGLVNKGLVDVEFKDGETLYTVKDNNGS